MHIQLKVLREEKKMVKANLIFSFLFLFLCIATFTCDARQGDHLTRLMKGRKIDYKSSFHVHDNKSSFHVHDNKSSFFVHDNKSSFHLHDNKSSFHVHDNKSSFHVQDNKSSFHVHDNKSSFHLHDNKSSFYVHDNKSSFHVQIVELSQALIPQKGSKANDKIQRLPGQLNDVNFTQYGGYVTVDEKAGRALFYYFVEVDGADPSSKPLVLWLNGGPGCSSLGYGAFTELGPFRVHSDGKTLYENSFAWNKVANVLFLESPAGVGFSYSNTASDYDQSGDNRTATDNYVFMVNWLERHPEYKSRDLYLAGENYAGHYVPQLAYTILKNNQLAKKAIINLKGIMVGNGLMNEETDSMGMYEYLWRQTLISDETKDKIFKYCDFSPDDSVESSECAAANEEVAADIQDIDLYNIYGPLCNFTVLTTKPDRASIINFDPCSEYYVHAYLNLPEVQEALHAANMTRLGHDWDSCSDTIFTWIDSPWSIIDLYYEFFAQGIRVWVYSGDNDAMVPVTSTIHSLKLLKLKVKSPWRPWHNRKEEVGGYTEVYEGDLTFATVRGAGHEVPSYQPPRALVLIDFFLKGAPLPSASAFN